MNAGFHSESGILTLIMEQILQLYNANKLSEALSQLDKLPVDSETLYMKGKILWKQGQRTQAMAAYAQSVELNPDSPAAIALQQARQIMDFYNKDLYNP